METAFTMDRVQRFAMAVVFGRFEGNDFDWDTMRYRERK